MSESIQIVIDESVDYAIVTALKKAGFSIFVIADETPSIPDNKVLEIAFTNRALLITEDKDFGTGVSFSVETFRNFISKND